MSLSTRIWETRTLHRKLGSHISGNIFEMFRLWHLNICISTTMHIVVFKSNSQSQNWVFYRTIIKSLNVIVIDISNFSLLYKNILLWENHKNTKHVLEKYLLLVLMWWQYEISLTSMQPVHAVVRELFLQFCSWVICSNLADRTKKLSWISSVFTVFRISSHF